MNSHQTFYALANPQALGMLAVVTVLAYHFVAVNSRLLAHHHLSLACPPSLNTTISVNTNIVTSTSTGRSLSSTHLPLSFPLP